MQNALSALLFYLLILSKFNALQMSYGLGKILFPSSPVERLALFLTGLCPGGGASNIWSIAVDANVNLSITMTTISMVAAFGKFFWD